MRRLLVAVCLLPVFAAAMPPRSFVEKHCVFVNAFGHPMSRQLSYTPDPIEALPDNLAASGKETLVIYFHGGLVRADAALQALQNVDSKAFAPAGAYTFGVVWNSDAETMAAVLRNEAGSAFADPVDALQSFRLGAQALGKKSNSGGLAAWMNRLESATVRSSTTRRFAPWLSAVTSTVRPSSLDAAGSARVRALELTTGPLATAVWERMKRSITMGCDASDARSVASRLLCALRNRPPKRIVLVGHSAGAVYALRFIAAARRVLPGTQFDVIFNAPALTYRETASGIETLRSSVCRFRMYALRDRLERGNTVLTDLIDLSCYGQPGKWFNRVLGQSYPGSLLYFVSNALEGPADVPLLGMERFIGVPRRYAAREAADRETVLAWLKPSENVGWSSGSVRSADPRPGFATAARRHGDFWDDPTTLDSMRLTILDWSTSTPCRR